MKGQQLKYMLKLKTLFVSYCPATKVKYNPLAKDSLSWRWHLLSPKPNLTVNMNIIHALQPHVHTFAAFNKEMNDDGLGCKAPCVICYKRMVLGARGLCNLVQKRNLKNLTEITETPPLSIYFKKDESRTFAEETQSL